MQMIMLIVLQVITQIIIEIIMPSICANYYAIFATVYAIMLSTETVMNHECYVNLENKIRFTHDDHTKNTTTKKYFYTTFAKFFIIVYSCLFLNVFVFFL